MKYNWFEIKDYRAIEKEIRIDLTKFSLVPLIGINECGKTTILQGIFCFDHYNDTENEGKHLQNIINLYKTTNKTPLIKANIQLTWVDYENAINGYNASIAILDEKVKNEKKLKEIENPILKANLKNNLTLIRDLNTKMYSCDEIKPNEIITAEIINDLIIRIMNSLPYILYNDDFNDRPQTVIEIPDSKPNAISGWLAIYERLFKKTSPDYSLFTIINEVDDRRQKSIISDVQDHLNVNLTKAWKTFSTDHKDNISINLSLKVNIKTKKNELHIDILEKTGQKERYFNILDRSKGFIWYFNFIMKVQYNPKIAGSAKSTIFLLDEPGSYLHAKAQEKLCVKLNEISNDYGVVIYCTHSHHLLNPDFIPPNCLKIIEKDADKNIRVIPLSLYNTKNEKTDALQPVYEALQLPNYEIILNVNDVLIVEGIYDKYVIEIFCDLDKNVRIMPSTSADAIVKNIQYLLTFGKNYIAIWDNDDEGKKNLEKAKKIFGPIEANKFDLLPSNGKPKRRMEQMFSNDDIRNFKNMLSLPESANYESIMLGLFYSKKEIKRRAKKIIEETTKNNFDLLKKIIIKRFKNNN